MTERDLAGALDDLARTLKDFDTRLRIAELAAAESKGMQTGLALNRRLREHEALQRERDDEVDGALAARPTRKEMEKTIAMAIDSSLKKWALRVFLALVGAAPVWITVSITIADRLT